MAAIGGMGIQLPTQWPPGQADLKRFWEELIATESAQGALDWEPVFREGVSYSLRARRPAGGSRALFAMVDIILQDQWWLSVCFYEDDISDPEERGQAIPGGLLGENGYCFDVAEPDADLLAYLKARLEEAGRAALGS